MTDGIVRRMMARKVEHWLKAFLGDQPPGNPEWPADAMFQMGALVHKKGRASWRGRIVGWYRTERTALGFAVESAFEPGSVQIYPQTALVPWEAA